MTVRHGLQAVGDAVAGGGSRADHIEGRVGMLGKGCGVGEHADGRGVDQHDIHGLIEPVQQGAQTAAAQKAHGTVEPGAAQKLHVGVGHRRQTGQHVQRRILQKLAQTTGLALDAEELPQLLGAQVRVDQRHLQARAAQAQGQVGGDGGLALAGHGAGDDDSAEPLLPAHAQHARAEHADGFLVDRRQMLVAQAQQIGALGASLELRLGHMDDARHIGIALQVGAGAHDRLHLGQQTQDRQGDQCGDQAADDGGTRDVQRPHRRDGPDRRLNEGEACRADIDEGHVGIALEHGVHDIVGVIRIGGAHRQSENTGVCNDARGNRAVDPAGAEFPDDPVAHGVGLDDRGECGDKLMGIGRIDLFTGTDDVGDGAVVHAHGQHGVAFVLRGIGPPGVEGHHQRAEHAGGQHDPEGAPQKTKGIGNKTEQVKLLRLFALFILHGCPPDWKRRICRTFRTCRICRTCRTCHSSRSRSRNRSPHAAASSCARR